MVRGKALRNQSICREGFAPSRFFCAKCRNSAKKLTDWEKVVIIGT